MLRREPPGGAFKGRHLPSQGEKVLPKGPLPRKDRPRKIEPTLALVDLDPWATEDRLEAREELRRVPLLDEEHSTAIGTALTAGEAEIMHAALKKNKKKYRHVRVDAGRHAGGGPGCHYPSTVNFQRGPPDLPKEKGLGRRKVTRG